jgi:hypothetical protein
MKPRPPPGSLISVGSDSYGLDRLQASQALRVPRGLVRLPLTSAPWSPGSTTARHRAAKRIVSPLLAARPGLRLPFCISSSRAANAWSFRLHRLTARQREVDAAGKTIDGTPTVAGTRAVLQPWTFAPPANAAAALNRTVHEHDALHAQWGCTSEQPRKLAAGGLDRHLNCAAKFQDQTNCADGPGCQRSKFSPIFFLAKIDGDTDHGVQCGSRREDSRKV